MKKEYFLLGILSVILLAAGVWIYQIISEYQKAEQEYEQLQEYVKVEKNTKEPENMKPETTEDDKEKEKPEETVTVDFATLQEINPDVVAWIRIPGVLEYPVVRGEDNSYYLNHTVQKTYNIAGSIFLDYRNERDFSDSKNIIYGHNMKDGSMFQNLHNYTDMTYMQQHPNVIIYTPDQKLTYQIFAAVVYDDRHILHSFDYAFADQRQAFLDSIYNSRNLGNVIRDDVSVNTDSRILTLSTCMTGQDDKRFLVEAVLISEED